MACHFLYYTVASFCVDLEFYHYPTGVARYAQLSVIKRENSLVMKFVYILKNLPRQSR